jgi:glycosyltransferase involved in cell wall biosynthesis
LRIALLIPAYNAAGTIARVIRHAFRFVRREDIIVIDDGSRDGTGEAARALGVTVLFHKTNRGKGAALRTGFERVIGGDYDGAVLMDADGQHEARFLPDFLIRASAGREGIIVGTRMDRVGQMPWIRQLTNRLTSAVISGMAGQRIPDSQSGYRFIRSDVLRRLRLTTSRYDTESEMLIQAGRMGYAIGAIPISSVYGEERSAIRPGRDTVRFIRLVLRTVILL